MAQRFIRVRAVGEGEAAYSCARVDPARGGNLVINGSRFVGRDPSGALVPEGERVPWSLHYHELIAQGQLELIAEGEE